MTPHELFDQWSTYEKIVANDYMYHRAYFAALGAYLAPRVTSPVAVLDLGCGDAQPMAPILQRFPIARYVGVDESTEALARARSSLASYHIDYELVEAPMERSNVDGRFDVIIASYSLHHLNRQDKRAMLEWCLERLNHRGVLAVIDVFLEPGEPRDDYLDRWESNASAGWKALEPPELAQLIEHVRRSDLPEEFEDYKRLAEGAGYRHVREIMQGPDRLNRFIILET